MQIAAQAINIGAEAVGGVYGVVQSADNGNAVGILAGALEAAASAAAGIGMLPGLQTQTYDTISAALGLASVATNMGSDFANGNLAQGLVDSLNTYLPAEGLASSLAQTNLQMNSAAFAAAEPNVTPNVAIPDFASAVSPASSETASATVSASAGSSGFNVVVTPMVAGGIANIDNTIGRTGTGGVLTQYGQTFAAGVMVAEPGAGDTTTTPSTVSPSQGLSYSSVMWFLGETLGIPAAEAAINPDTAQVSLANQINNYLSAQAPNSPLNGMGSAIVADSVTYGVDPRLRVALAAAETQFGNHITSGTNNIFNNLYAGSNSNFDSVESAIMSEAKMIGRTGGNYFGQGLTTSSSLYGRYCAGPDCSNGLSNLNTVLRTLGGNPINLQWTSH